MDRYDIVELLIAGTINADIYVARQKDTDKEVILKTTSRISLERERDVHSELRHVSIAEFIESFWDQGKLSLVIMRYRRDLQQLYTEEPIASNVIQQYVRQLLQGVEYIHSRGYMHRDIKPDNLFIDEKNHLKIGDFGLARTQNGEKTPDTTTLWYRPIEVLLGCKNYTKAVDLWSVGCVLAELYRRHPLFHAPGSVAMMGLIVQVCQGPTDPQWPSEREFPVTQYFTIILNAECNIAKAVPNAVPLGVELLKQLLQLDHNERISAADALEHEYFRHPDDSTVRTEITVPEFPPVL